MLVAQELEALRETVWLEDIPSPTTLEYKEHHKSIQKILQRIDTLLEKVAEVELMETARLFAELKTRKGVEIVAEVAPHDTLYLSDINMCLTGPCILLNVYD